MPVIRLETLIKADVKKVFDLARSIDLHKQSLSHTKEVAIAGVTKGLINMGESVTWRGKHFGIYFNLTSRITEFNAPHAFVDEMVKGPFRSFRHEHIFEFHNEGCQMTDIFQYVSPLGSMGKLADWLFLTKYMRKLLETRNMVIKNIAENPAQLIE